MNIGATQVLSGGHLPPPPARRTAAAVVDARAVVARTPVERVVEGEVLGRGRPGYGAATGEYAARMRMHTQAGVESSTASGRLAALALYAGVSAGSGRQPPAARLDVYV